MCELLALSSNRPATLSLSLMKLAEHGGYSGPHKDGWGVAYYEGADVRLIKEAEAAYGSAWIRFLRDHKLRSEIIIAHVRRATMGDPTYRNTQPFARELAGRMHLFAHNGWLPGIFNSDRFKSARFHPIGETDSERAFCVLLDRMTEVWRQPGETPSLDSRLSIVSSFAEELRLLGPSNFLYSDGNTLFAHGHRRIQAATSKVEPPGLVLLQRWCRKGEKGPVGSGFSVEGTDQSIAMLASVPLTDEPWIPLGEGEVIAIYQGEVAARHPAASNPVGGWQSALAR